MKTTQLNRELRQAGAEQAEAAGLTQLAGQLHQLSSRPVVSGRRHLLRASLVAGLVMAAVIAYAQISLPGSWSYPVKRLSEQTVVAMIPSYRATIMMRRSVEVKDLVAQHASSQAVLATLADYHAQAVLYESSDKVNYQAFTYCKNMLIQAAQLAPEDERSAITNTLNSLQT